MFYVCKTIMGNKKFFGDVHYMKWEVEECNEAQLEEFVESVTEQSIAIQRKEIQHFLNKWIQGMIEKAIEITIQKWLNAAREFIKVTFPDWETSTRGVPPLGGGNHSSLVSFLLDLGRNVESPCSSSTVET